MMKKIRVLCLSGSLRKNSYNTAVIKAIAALAPPEIEIEQFSAMDLLPLFNPDREDENIIPVKQLKMSVGRADGLIIASPEYAHGVTGVIKNALDWLVSGDEFPDLPVALINTSPRAEHAQAALREIISTMSGKIIDDACISIALLGSGLDAEGIVQDAELSAKLSQALDLFYSAITKNDR